ncbi:hypothetical protein BOTBODRAFT_168595 [Botryobasidium botryosum FD-172 SS1]|uniref:Uncharacterized protein n=1 Tax=Botryobasidium botryosum (strain FD-172 SS1) TaxID=930990 RepID=A0A067N0C2_BOTB1|nr:hypothetical protein BOTBODRAFT_168595 [Botryobasidium botryosum FD-172 SS1]
MSPTIASAATHVLRAAASATTTNPAELKAPPQFKVVGIVLAVCSGLLIGSSFVFKKKGLLQSQAGATAGEGVAYLKSVMWWTGMTMMILGELCNFAAYAFVEALVVTPLGALSVVICAILSSIFLKETLTFFGWIGCFLCIVGSVTIALNGPQEQTASTILEFQALFLAPAFLAFGSVVLLSALIIIFFVAPKYGKKHMLWYIIICSLFGGLSVSCTQGLGSAIVTSIRGENQFKHWFIYFLLGFVVVTLLTEIYFLNMALALFNTAMVTPTYYVIFTFCTLVTSVILYQGLKASAVQILTIVMGFLTICAGITILQMSKVDPTSLKKLDRRSTMLLQANRNTEASEKNVGGIEDPGMDALRGTFGTVGSIIRARSARRASLASRVGRNPEDMETGTPRAPRQGSHTRESGVTGSDSVADGFAFGDLPRHQLYDPPMPSPRSVPPLPDDAAERISQYSTTSKPTRGQSIRFEDQSVAHYYPGPGVSGPARHDTVPNLPPLPLSPRMRAISVMSEDVEPGTITIHLPPVPASPVPTTPTIPPPPSSNRATVTSVSTIPSEEFERGLATMIAPAGGVRMLPTSPRPPKFHDPFDGDTSPFPSRGQGATPIKSILSSSSRPQSPAARPSSARTQSPAPAPSQTRPQSPPRPHSRPDRRYPSISTDENPEESIGLVGHEPSPSVEALSASPSSDEDTARGGIRLLPRKDPLL